MYMYIHMCVYIYIYILYVDIRHLLPRPEHRPGDHEEEGPHRYYPRIELPDKNNNFLR